MENKFEVTQSSQTAIECEILNANKREIPQTKYGPRTDALVSIFRSYKDHPEIQRSLWSRQINPPDLTGHPVRDYRAEAFSFPLLEREEELALLESIQAGYVMYEDLKGTDTKLNNHQDRTFLEAAIAQRVMHASNMRLAFKIAQENFSYTSGGLSPADHLQEADFGILDAINRYDTSTSNKFSTYAYAWVRKRVLRNIANNGRTIRAPEHQQNDYARVSKLLDHAVVLKGAPLTNTDIEEVANMSFQDYTKLANTAGSMPRSLDWQIFDDNGDSLIDTISTGTPQDSTTVTDRALDILSIARDNLSENELFMLGLRFNLAPDDIGNPTFRSKTSQAIAYTEAYQKNIDEPTHKNSGTLAGVSAATSKDYLSNALKTIRQASDTTQTDSTSTSSDYK